MKKIVLLLGIVSTFSLSDTILGGEINAGFYNHTPKGVMDYKGESIDIVDSLNWENEGDVFASLYFEHPLPLIPNIKVGYSTLGHSGSGKVPGEITFGDKTFSKDVRVDSGFDVKFTDATLYYEILDNWISIDIGLTAKLMDGNVYLKNKIDGESLDFKEVLPLVYTKFRFDIPSTDIALQVEGNYIAYQSNLLYDIEVGIRYTVLLGIGAEVGLKQLKLKVDDIEGFNMDVDFSGLYGKLVWDF